MNLAWGGTRRRWCVPVAVAVVASTLVAVVADAATAAPSGRSVAAGTSIRSATAGPSPASDALVGGPSGVEGLVPLAPVRVLDTRAGYPGSTPGRGPAAPREVLAVAVAAAAGVPASSIAGVAVNVTVTNPTAAGYITVFPGGAAPVASTVNFTPGQTVPSGAIVGVSPAGTISLLNGSPGTVDLVVDVTGWVPVNAGFTPISPVRALETRAGEPGYRGGGALAPGEARVVDVGAVVPGALNGTVGGRRITAVTVNLTAVSPTRPGYLTLYPEGAAVPPTSSVNFVAGQIVPNSAVVGVGPTGRVVVVNPIGVTHVVLDVTGYLVEGRTFKGVAPQRLLDTRTEYGGTGALGPHQTVRLKVDALAGLPRGFVGAVALNLTVPRAAAAGYLTAYPSSSPVPPSSSVNFVAGGAPVANTVVVGADEDGIVAVTNGSAGAVDVIVDLTGWFPQDALGLVADARQTRRYSLGDDRLAVVGCVGGSYDAAPYLAKLGDITAFYEWLSAGRYRPTFLGAGAGPADSNCTPAAGWPSGITGAVRLVPPQGTGAYGLAGPGYVCADVSCTSGRSYPGNQRDALFTANALVSSGTVYFSVAAHEFGHMLDWPHSYTAPGPADCREYDNPLDVMSREPRGGGTGCTINGKTPDMFATPQATLAMNRYAAGWVDPMAVTVHPGGSATYTLAAKGGYAAGAGQELLVLPTPDGAAFYTLEVRAHAVPWDPTLATYEGQLQGEGVAVHAFDQRADVDCYLAVQYGLDRCSGLNRRNKKLGTANAYDNLVPGGASSLVPGVALSVVKVSDGVYQVTVTGSAGAYAPIADAHLESGTAVGPSPSSSAPSVVCLVSTGGSAGVATAYLPPDDRRRQGPTPAVTVTG